MINFDNDCFKTLEEMARGTEFEEKKTDKVESDYKSNVAVENVSYATNICPSYASKQYVDSNISGCTFINVNDEQAIENPECGSTYYDSGTNSVKMYTGTEWSAISSNVSERMCINSEGYVGIGITTPTTLLTPKKPNVTGELFGSVYPHHYWLKCESGYDKEVVLVKAFPNGDRALLFIDHLDSIDLIRIREFLLSEENHTGSEFWSVLKGKTLSNGINALTYFHQLVKILKTDNSIVDPNINMNYFVKERSLLNNVPIVDDVLIINTDKQDSNITISNYDEAMKILG